MIYTPVFFPGAMYTAMVFGSSMLIRRPAPGYIPEGYTPPPTSAGGLPNGAISHDTYTLGFNHENSFFVNGFFKGTVHDFFKNSPKIPLSLDIFNI